MSDLSGKVALITGASRGIGAAIARAMATAGAAVAINYVRDREGADALVAEIEGAGGKAIAVQGNVASPDDVKRMMAQIAEALGPIGILVNNAAAYDMAALEDITEAEYRRHFDTNVLGPTLLIQAALDHFRPGSSVINISSTIVINPEPLTLLYSASKAALDMLTVVLAKELGPRQIRVNTLAPGLTDTENHMVSEMGDAIVAPLVARTPMGRIGLPQEIAPAAVFLASDEAGWITGTTLRVSGGFQ